jgi:transposase InsO family protein
VLPPLTATGRLRLARCVVERVLTDNAWAYAKNTWRETCHDLGISPRWTRSWRPQTNGKV